MRVQTETRRARWFVGWLAVLCVCLSVSRGADLARAEKLLAQATALIEAARAELQAPGPTNPTPARVDLGTFRWSAAGMTDPAGFAYARRSEPTLAYGKRNVQWYERWKPGGGMILHAAWTPGATSASGASAQWYLFTPGTVAEIPEQLAHYGWTQTGPPDTDAVGTWIRWRRTR